MTSPEVIRGWLDRNDILILDTETTGFSVSAEVIEVVMTRVAHRAEADCRAVLDVMRVVAGER